MSFRFLPLSLPFIGIYLSSMSLILVFTNQDSLAQRLSKQSSRHPSQNAIAAGTRIPVRSLNFERILLTEQESLTLEVIVSTNLYNRQGKVTLPSGSQIQGEIMPIEDGVQLKTSKVQLNNQIYPIEAISQVISRRKTIESQKDIEKLGNQILIGDQASQAIAALIGQNASQVNLQELAEWLLGRLSIDLILIYPNQDLTLTLQSDLRLD